jgi:hypothetical protein
VPTAADGPVDDHTTRARVEKSQDRLQKDRDVNATILWLRF